MNWWLLFIPVISAFVGWAINSLAIKMLFSNVLPKRQPEIAARLGKVVSSELFSFSELEAKVTSVENIEKIMPLAEGHIDHFLRNKLGQAFPMISMFIGDKTINQLKGIFMEELATIFPQLLKSYVGNLQQQLDLEQVVTQKIANIPPGKLETVLRQELAKEFRFIQLLGLITGLFAGLIAVVITLLTN